MQRIPAKHRALGRSVIELEAREPQLLGGILNPVLAPLLGGGTSATPSSLQPSPSPSPSTTQVTGGKGSGGGVVPPAPASSTAAGGSGVTPSSSPSPNSPAPAPNQSLSSSASSSSGGGGDFVGTGVSSAVPVNVGSGAPTATSVGPDTSAPSRVAAGIPVSSQPPQGVSGSNTMGIAPSATLTTAAAVSSSRQLSAGAIAGIVIVCLLGLVALVVLIVRRRSIARRIELRQQWIGDRNSSGSFSFISNPRTPSASSGAIAASRNSARSSFATNFDQGLMFRVDSPMGTGSLGIVPEFPPMAEVRDPNRLPILNNYARTLGNLARRKSDLDDLDLSVKYFYEALELCHATARCVVLTNLAAVLTFRFSLVDDISDADIAFALCKAALELREEGHPIRGMLFLIQAKAVICRLSRKHALPDVEMAIDILHAARDASTPGHPLLIETYQELSSTYSHRHAITNCDNDLEEAFKYRMAATKHSNGGSKSQFEAAMRWVQDAETFRHSSVLTAYKSAIQIVDLHLVLKPSVDLRHDIIKTAALSVCADATSCALRHGDVVGAVEMFEHSRGLFWTHIGRLRTPLDELWASGPVGEQLAGEFESLSRQLEVPVTLEDNGEQGQRFRRIQKDWTAVVDKIRSMDGFDKFLLPPSYADLRGAANGGPVIILNASRYSCDAIIVLANDAPIHIPFPEGTFSDVVSMSSEFSRLLSRQENNERGIAALLRRLWQTVVYEVVCALEPHLPKNSRIWWCPTGPFTSLPLHAAHPYRKGEPGLSDLYVSSYTPTLSALIRSRNKRSEPPSTPSFLSIGQPNSAGYELLLSVRQELDAVRQLLPGEVQLTELSDEAATREAALTALSTHTYAHLACHGEQVPERPFDSHFAMHDGHLSLLDIIRSQLGHETEFAFLSACKTATGDGDAPDEVIHLAAAMQFAGVRNVVGTMWSVDDRVVVGMVEAFYRAMINEDGMFDPSRAARALRAATRSTMDRVPLDQRIVFIHIGV